MSESYFYRLGDDKRSPGEYKFKHKGSGQEFKFRKHHNQGGQTEAQPGDLSSEELREMEGFSAIIFMSLMMAFSITCCCAMMYASCILGGLYKFHYTTKELDIIQDLPSVQQMQMHQFPAHQPAPQNIVRGHVVMMPQQP